MRSHRLPTYLALGLVLVGLAGAVTGSAQPAQNLQDLAPPLPAIPDPPAPLRESSPSVPSIPPMAPAQPPPFRRAPAPAPHTPRLAWDADFKPYVAKPGEMIAHFEFNLTNISTIDIVVNRVTTSCGCTVARLPNVPWRLPPGAFGKIDVTVDLRGKWGTLQKFITVETSDGFKPLRVQITIPTQIAPPPAVMVGRSRNLEVARADRQAVFKGDCARCHADPTTGKTGTALFQAACAICHESAHRATMVPDLRTLKHPTDRPFWRSWIASGKPGTLMPAFAKAQGGPLNDAQIDSLVEYATRTFLQRTAALPSAPAVPPGPPPLPPSPPVLPPPAGP